MRSPIRIFTPPKIFSSTVSVSSTDAPREVSSFFFSSSAVSSGNSLAVTSSTTTIPSADLISSASVSYTHLRAHETDSYLVCRLLLEKKNKRYHNNHTH